MNASINDINAYLAPLFSEYPHLPSDAKEYVLREINALQSRYFGEYAGYTDLLSLPLPDDFMIGLELLTTDFGTAPTKERLTAVFAGDEQLPLLDTTDSEAYSGKCCTVRNNILYIKGFADSEDVTIKLIYKICPPLLTLNAATGIHGAIYIPEKHLPLLYNKTRECVCRLAGEQEEADLYARAYNAFLESMPDHLPYVSKRKAL